MATLTQDLKKLQTLKAKAAASKKKWEKEKEAADKWEAHCYDRMEQQDTESQKVAGVNFVRYQQTFGSIQDRSEFVKWAEENEPELIESRERKELINQKVRELLDNGQEFPPGLGFRVNDKVGVRGANKKSE